MAAKFNKATWNVVGFTVMCLSLAGCFSRISFSEAPKPNEKQPAVYIYRPDSPPHLRRASVFVNEQKVADLASEEFSWINVRPGPYIIHVKWSPDLFISTENINVTVKENEILFVKVEPSALIVPGASGIVVKLSYGTHPDQITQVWPLKYVVPNDMDLKPLQ